jgi:hypothetical protein
MELAALGEEGVPFVMALAVFVRVIDQFEVEFVTAVRVIVPFVAELKSALLVWFQVVLEFENFGEEAVSPKKP